MNWMKNAVKAMVVMGTVSVYSTWAQPSPAPTAGDAPCGEEPTNLGDTVTSVADADGYHSLFDGTLKGWWQSCKSAHSSNSPLGAIFRIGQADGKPAIYSTQRVPVTGTGGIGGILMTNKKFSNYEIVMQVWPDFKNDGGIFNRTTAKGQCFQTTLDYIGGGAFGGTWGEGGFTGRDYRPFGFGGDETSLNIPGNGNELSNWTTITSKLNPTSFGCPASGCTQAEWRTMWNMDDWNDIKVQFYGGSAAGTGNIHMKFWFKKPTSNTWVPTIQDTTLAQVVPPSYVGLQVHGGGRFGGPKGTWYRNIKWRPLTDKGEPILPTVGMQPMEKNQFDIKVSSNALVGSLDADHQIIVQDLQGKTLETFTGHAGKFNYALKSEVYGWLSIQIKSARGIESTRVLRVRN